MLWTLPNILTVARLLAAPCVALSFMVLPRPLADVAALTLFVSAALTDYLDGWLARRWSQISKFGTMLDPIADKVMVVIALCVLLALFGPNPLLFIPATIILFREIFVSGLREFLGADAKTLKVTSIAKWKTMVQMVAIAMLFVMGFYQYHFEALYYANDPQLLEQIGAGDVADTLGLLPILWWYDAARISGVALIWLAAALTLVSGADYFRKALPFLRG